MLFKHLNYISAGLIRFLKYLFFNLLRFFRRRSNVGSVLIEALLALAIGAAILTAVSTALVTSQQANLQSSQYQQAQLYIQEAEEAVRSLWLSGWDNLNLTGIFHPEVLVDDWQLIAGDESLGIYTRQIEIDQVFRDLNGNIATQGGTLDPSTKKVTTTVSWQIPRFKSIARSFFITRYKDNLVWFENTAEDFADGTEDATDVFINPGYVQLAQTGGGGWTEPASIGTVDGLTKASGIWATDEYIYLTQDKLIGGVEVFNIIDSPATPSSVGYFGTTYRPNDAAASNGYLYIADSFFVLPSLHIYDIAADPINPPYVNSEVIILPAGGIWATDDYLYITGKDMEIVYVYQLSGGHHDDPEFLGFFSTPEDTVDVAVSGNYLYVAQQSTSQAVEIYDISGVPTWPWPAWPTHVGTLSTLYEPTGIWSESNILYISMKQKRGAMYSIASDPTNPQLYGYFPTERTTADVAAYGDYGYVAGADSQSKVIEIFDLSDSKGVSGIYFVYGEYISSTLDAISQAAFNRISWEGNELPGTNIFFQIATNDDDLTWNFVGPDGTAGSYFEDPGAVPLNSILGRYFRYKIILTGDSDTTPTVDNVTVNYSP